jgi:MarR family transcriptional regulator for hemolysin
LAIAPPQRGFGSSIKIVWFANDLNESLFVRFSEGSGATASDLNPLSPNAPFFGQVLMHLSRQWRRVLELRLAELDLTDATWVPLFHLHAGGDGISLKALAERVSLDSSTLVRVVDLLEARGLVIRETDGLDRRSKLLYITPAGDGAIADVRAKLQQAETHLLAGMDASAVQALRAGMEQLTQRMVVLLQQDGVSEETRKAR